MKNHSSNSATEDTACCNTSLHDCLFFGSFFVAFGSLCRLPSLFCVQVIIGISIKRYSNHRVMAEALAKLRSSGDFIRLIRVTLVTKIMKRKLQFALDDGGFNDVIISYFSSCKMLIQYCYII